jgi:hypothetical protein
MIATLTNLQKISPNAVEEGQGVPSGAVTPVTPIKFKSGNHDKMDNNLKNNIKNKSN